MNDLQILDAKIEIARNYLKEYYSASVGPQIQKRFTLTFLDVDRASVHWVDGPPVIDYRLAFLPSGKMEWRCLRTSRQKTEAIPVEEIGKRWSNDCESKRLEQ